MVNICCWLTYQNGLSAIIQRSFPSQLASIGSDIWHLQWSFRSCRSSKNDQLHPFFIKTIAVLCSDLVLAVVLPQSILDFKDGVVVTVGQLYPLMFFRDEKFLSLGDIACTLSPGFIGNWLSNDIDWPRVGSTNLLKSL